MKVTLLENNRCAVGRAIEAALEHADSFDAAVAFVKRSGLETAPALRAFAQSKPLRLLAGTDFSQTEIEAVDDLTRSGASSKVYVEGFARSAPTSSVRCFHPKVYLAARPDKIVAIVGSANLTRGGFRANHEACYQVEGDPDEPVLRQTLQYFDGLWRNPYSLPVDDQFREQYRRVREARRRTENSLRQIQAGRGLDKILRAHLVSLVTGAARPSEGNGPQTWVLVTSLANFEVCRNLQWWGDIDEGRIGKLHDGDAVIFYIKGVKRLGGVGLVRGTPFPLPRNPWPEGKYAWGLQVDFLLSPDITIDFLALIEDLEFIKNKAVWGTHLQGFMRRISYHDFEVMRGALAEATMGTVLPMAADG